MHHVDATKAKPDRPVFGRWLLNQQHAIGADAAVKAFAGVAAQDCSFPRDGNLQDVSAYLNRSMADHETHETLEQAVWAWTDA